MTYRHERKINTATGTTFCRESKILENEIYEKDYSKEYAKSQSDSPDLLSNLIDNEFFKYYGAFMSQIPKYIVVEDKATYERILKRCDAIAKERHGKVYGIVNYEKWEARIKLTLPFIEFTSYEDLDFLMDLSENVQTICFQPARDGVSMTIMFNYFNEVELAEDDLSVIARKAAAQAGLDKLDKQAIADLKDIIMAYADNESNE